MFRLATKIFVTKQKEKDGSIFIGFLVPKEGWWVDGFWNSCVDPSWQQATQSLKPTNDEASAFRRSDIVVLNTKWLLSFSHGLVSFSKKVRLFSRGAMLMALSDEMVAALMRLRNIREDKNERIKRKYDGRRNITKEKSAQHWWW